MFHVVSVVASDRNWADVTCESVEELSSVMSNEPWRMFLRQQHRPSMTRELHRAPVPFDGTDQALIAQCLGLDSSKYKQRQGKSYASKDDLNHDEANNNLDDEEFENEYLFGEGSEAFKQCDPFVFPCLQCETLNFWNAPFVFNEVSERNETMHDGFLFSSRPG